MSTKTSLMIFGIVAMSMALIAAASLTNLAIAANDEIITTMEKANMIMVVNGGSGAVVAAAVVDRKR